MRTLALCVAFIASVSAANAATDCTPKYAAEEYCARYSLTKSLERDKDVQAAKVKCVDFYKSAIEAATLLCQYKADSEKLAAESGRTAEGVDSDKSSFEARHLIGENAKALYDKYAANASELRRVLVVNFEHSKDDLGQLSKIGSEILKEEVHCQRDGKAGRPPGFLLIGLGARAYEEQFKTKLALESTLTSFIDYVRLSVSNLKMNQNRLKSLKSSLDDAAGNVAPEENIDPMEQSLPGESKQPIAQIVEGKVRDNFQNRGSKTIINILEETSKAGKKFVNWGGGDAVFTLITKGEIDRFDMVQIGSGIVLALTGTAAGPTAITSAAVAFITDKMREYWKEQDYKILRAYQGFVDEQVKLNSGISSSEVAQAYRPTKEKRNYCMKCNIYDEQNCCPARNSYNDNWFSGLAGPPTQWPEETECLDKMRRRVVSQPVNLNADIQRQRYEQRTKEREEIDRAPASEQPRLKQEWLRKWAPPR